MSLRGGRGGGGKGARKEHPIIFTIILDFIVFGFDTN